MIDLEPNMIPEPGAGPGEDATFGRRIEDWIVSTIDLDGSSPGGPAWGPRKASPGPAAVAVPADAAPWPRFRLSKHRGVALVALTDPALLKEGDLAELIEDLGALIGAGRRRLVIDFAAVERISTWAAAALARAIGRFGAAEAGSIKLAGVRPELAPALAVVGLDRIVPVCPDAVSAIVGPWPDRDELRPLPVSILAALLTSPRGCTRPGPTGPLAPDLDLDLDLDDGGTDAMTRIRLIIQDGPSMGRAVEVKTARFVIGRCPACDLRVASSAVSRSHATLSKRGGRLFLRDLASTNGTRLNGRALREVESEVRDGDTIRVGPVEFALAIDEVATTSAPQADPRPWTIGPGAAEAGDETLDLAIGSEFDGYRSEVMEGALVVTPVETDLCSEEAIGRLRDALVGLADRGMPRRVVLSLAHVGQISSRAIGVLVAHHFRLDRTGGALRVCLANPRVALVLDQVRLPMLVDCHQTVEDAVIAAWPRARAEASARA